jgi:hypothetical protein
MKSLLLFIPRLLASAFLIALLPICMAVFLIECPIGLIVFMIHYRSLRSNGTGVFHTLFFRCCGVYQILSCIHKIWKN